MNENNLIKIESSARTNNNPIANILASLTSGNILLPLMLFFLLNKDGNQKFSTDEIYRTAEILKIAQPYFKDQHRDMLARTENILDIMQSMNRYTKGEYKDPNRFNKSYYHVPDKHIKIMEAIRPYIKGQNRQSIDKALTLNDRVNRLKNRDGTNKNIIEDIENMTDILEIISADKGYEVRNVLDKVHKMMAILGK